MSLLAGLGRSVVQYFQGAYREFTLVTWPTRAAVTQYTILVIVTIVVTTLILTAFDYGMQQLTNQYLIR